MGNKISDVEEIKRVSLKKDEYAYIEDSNTGAVLVKEGPKVLTLDAHQKLIKKEKKIILGSGRYCIILNPVSKDESNNVLIDDYEQAELRVGDKEVRVGPSSFALYPGEILDGTIKKEYVLGSYDALKVLAKEPFIDNISLSEKSKKEKKRNAGDEWLIKGPCKYIPPKDVEVLSQEKAIILKETEYCIILNPVDESGIVQEGKRKVVSGPYVFFVEPNEEALGGIKEKYILNENQGILLQAISDFIDNSIEDKEIKRKAGDKWVVRGPIIYTPNKYIEVERKLDVISLGQGEGIYVKNLKSGKIKLIVGPTQFMLEAFQEFYEKKLPSIVESALSKESKFGEGISIQAFNRMRTEDTYLQQKQSAKKNYIQQKQNAKDNFLQQESIQEDYVQQQSVGKFENNKLNDDINRYKAIVLNIENNCATLINDYETSSVKVIFGPSEYILKPYEEVKVLNLSGETPKRPGKLQIIKLRLGPDFMTDMFEVATRDHARLKIKLSYKWCFDIDKNSKEPEVIFKVADFVGYACENLASRIRQVAAENDFETFHQNSSKLIRESVFGIDEKGKIKKFRLFPENNLKIIDIDIKNIIPVNQDTADKLKEAIDTNIQIQLDASKQEAEAKAELRKIESAREMNMAKLNSEKEQEEKRSELIELQNQNEQLESVEKAKIEAQAELESQRIETQSELEKAEAEAKAMQIRTNAEIDREQKLYKIKIEKEQQLSNIKIDEAKQKSDIEIKLFEEKLSAMGGGKIYAEVMKHMSKSGIYGNIKKMIFVPEGSKLNLINSMDNLFADPDSSILDNNTDEEI